MSLRVGLAGCLVYVAVAGLLAGHPEAARVFVASAGYFAPGLVLWAVARGWRRWAGCQRVFWGAFVLAILLFAAGQVAWTFNDLVVGLPLATSFWQTLLQLFRLTVPLLAVLARPQRGARETELPAIALDMAAAAIVAAFLYSFFVVAPGFGAAGRDQAVAALALFGNLQRPALLAALVWSAYDARRSAWQPTYWRLIAGLSIGLALAPVPFDTLIGAGPLSTALQHLGLIVPQVFYAWAAETAPASDAQTEFIPATSRSVPLVICGTLLLVAAVAYVGVLVWPLPDPLSAFRNAMTGGALIALFALLVGRFGVQQLELKRSDARVRLLAKALEQTDNLVQIRTSDGRFEFANHAFCRAMRRSPEELRAIPASMLYAEDAAHVAQELKRAAITEGSAHGMILRRRGDGSTFFTHCSVAPLFDPAGSLTHFVWVERDMTGELRMREELIQAERRSAVVQLVAGVAHEVNNPLQSIVGLSELMLVTAHEPEIRADVMRLRESAMRAGQIVRHLLTFVRKSSRDREPVAFNAFVEEAVALRATELAQAGVELEEDYAPDLPPVEINRDEIQQIVLNLVTNAEYALQSTGRGGRLRVRTGYFDGLIVLEVIDDGPGVPPEAAGRIFEPFFTTKPVGEGTGLGLSIAFGIANAHGGALELVPTTAGACFRLSLPAVRARARAAGTVAEQPTSVMYN